MDLNKIKDIFTHVNKQLSQKEWEDTEEKLGGSIPLDVKLFYKTVNGGQPNGKLSMNNGNYEIVIKKIMPIKYNSDFHNEKESTMEGMTMIQRSYDAIGPDELIIGMAKGKLNRICVNTKTGAVELFPLIGLNKEAFIFGKPIFISDSFEHFISMLQYEPEEADTNNFKREPKTEEKLHIDNSAQQLTSEDLVEFEKDINFQLPATMKKFYQKNNGGMPNLDFFQPQYGDLDEVEINRFLPIKYSLEGVLTIEETARSLWEREMISKSLLPFAIDSGSNLYAIHRDTLHIYYIVMDIWHDEWSKDENFKENSTKIASSFRYFVTHLMPEE